MFGGLELPQFLPFCPLCPAVDTDIGNALWESPGNVKCRHALTEATKISLGWDQRTCLFELFRAGVVVKERIAHIEFVGRSLTPALLPAGTGEATSASSIDAWLRIERAKSGCTADLED